MAGGRLKADAVYLGLTRPPMIFGVTYTYFILNGAICMCTYIQTNNVWYIFVCMPVLHVFGYYICLKDPRMIDLFLLTMGKCRKCINRWTRHYGNNSYDMF